MTTQIQTAAGTARADQEVGSGASLRYLGMFGIVAGSVCTMIGAAGPASYEGLLSQGMMLACVGFGLACKENGPGASLAGALVAGPLLMTVMASWASQFRV